MSTITYVDIPEANEVARNLDAAIAKFSAALSRMQRIAAALDGCWGDDEFGHNFAKSYLEDAKQTLENGGLTVQTVTSLAENLRKLAGLFEQVDKDGGGVLTLKDE